MPDPSAPPVPASPDAPRPPDPSPPAPAHAVDGRDGPIARWLAQGPTLAAMLGLFALGLVVFWPSIATPLWLDDYLHRAMVNHAYPSPRGPFELYDFVSDRDRDVLLERGILPWWTNPGLKIRFLRPLSSVLLYGDHATFGQHPLVMHLHSYAWWVACVLGARGLFQRFFKPRVALFATTVFALAPCHAIPLAWLANREALVSLAFGLMALGQYEDFRGTRSPKRALAATVLFALSMAGGEYSLLLAGYVLAAELFTFGRDQERPARRATGLFPWLAPTLAYLLARRHLGYGAAGSGFYSDPTQDLGEFLSHAPRRFVALVVDAWLSLDGDFTRARSTWQLGLGVLVLVVLLAAPVYAAFSRLDDPTAGRAKALLTGSVLGLLPALAVSASPRLVAASLVGVAATVAIVLEDAWFAPPAPVGALESAHAPRGQLTALAAYGLGFLHLLHAPTTSWIVGKQIGFGARTFAAQARSLGRRAGAPADTDVQLVRAPNAAFFMPFALNPTGTPPRRWRVLARPMHLLATRDDARSLTLTAPRDVSLFTTEDGDVFGAAKTSVGKVFKVQGMQVEILEIGREGPSRARFTFEQDLGAEGMAWFTETARGFPALDPPEPGFGAPFDP